MTEERLSNDELSQAIQAAWHLTQRSTGKVLALAELHFQKLLDAQAKRAEMKEPSK